MTIVYLVKLVVCEQSGLSLREDITCGYMEIAPVVVHKTQAVLLINTINGLAQGQLPAGRKGKADLPRLNLVCFVLDHIWMHSAHITVAYFISFCKLLLFLPPNLMHPFD